MIKCTIITGFAFSGQGLRKIKPVEDHSVLIRIFQVGITIGKIQIMGTRCRIKVRTYYGKVFFCFGYMDRFQNRAISSIQPYGPHTSGQKDLQRYRSWLLPVRSTRFNLAVALLRKASHLVSFNSALVKLSV